MPQPYIFRTVELDHQSIRTAVRPGKPHLTPLLIFNGIGANLELVFPFCLLYTSPSPRDS